MIKLKNIVKTYDTPNGSVHALKDINLEIKRGEIYGIIGLSGAGKSSLINAIFKRDLDKYARKTDFW